MNKQEVRRLIKERLDVMENRAEKERLIHEHVLLLPEWQQATCVAITLAFRNECDTRMLIEQAWQEGKTVLIPKVVGDEMVFYEHGPEDQLQANQMGIAEPTASARRASLAQAELCLVPGRAYRRDGYRLGWGGGYYDRALVTYAGRKVSIAFSEQLLSDFEVEAFDIPVDLIVTDLEVIRC
ncbi:5-formyltetrahydrofolate cyclo-ligase [Exiguobacterium acetylicum]|uniref:5-formyltetrahydrofolate cyclo-ligase n=1 Tax=Exiguobacterium acetylicum TaxID=41170 RepID=UPI001CA6D26A|nr:5-formyltetrahydrofolate cyclo-ligase [Exiguobacterium acetylicum]QZY87657.1 5-formyltetrahydrofolate cyclo-ligase [Exiguobacterium acetylicum]